MGVGVEDSMENITFNYLLIENNFLPENFDISNLVNQKEDIEDDIIIPPTSFYLGSGVKCEI